MGSRLKKLRAVAPRPGSRLFHYTIGQYLPNIVEAGEIFAAEEGVSGDEKPAVWCSFHSDWEPTATKSYLGDDGRRVMGTREMTMRLGAGLARIEVAVAAAPHGWREHVRLSGIEPAAARRLVQAALSDGADPEHWRVSFESIRRDQWMAIEINRGDGWKAWEPGA